MDFLQIIGGEKRKVINSQSPEVFTYLFQTRQVFSRVFWGAAFCFFQFPQCIPCWQTAQQHITGYGDLQLQSLGFPFGCKRAASGTPSPAAAEVISQTAGPATDQDPKGVKGSVSGPLVREGLFYHTVFRDLSLPLPSSIRTVKKICFKHVMGTVSIRK